MTDLVGTGATAQFGRLERGTGCCGGAAGLDPDNAPPAGPADGPARGG